MNTRRTLAALAATALALTIASPADARPASRTIPAPTVQLKDSGCRDGQPLAYYEVDAADGVRLSQPNAGLFGTETLTITAVAPRGLRFDDGSRSGTRAVTLTVVNNTWGEACGWVVE